MALSTSLSTTRTSKLLNSLKSISPFFASGLCRSYANLDVSVCIYANR
jgi:hypothetical protein